MDLLFVHGALVRDGAWWWQPTADLLVGDGIASRALRVPSCGEGTPDEIGGGLRADAAALRRALDEVDPAEGAIVVGHSYGGTVIAEAGTHPAVRHLLLISSYLPDVGASQGSIMSGEPDPVQVAPNNDGTISVAGLDATSFRARFLQDVPESVAGEAWDRVTAQALAAFGTETTAAGWQGVDSTFLVCTEDRSTSVELQRFHAARATRSVDLPTGHHPFIARPELVAEQVRALLPG
ncbi:alpha/beta hydrolase [Curtobacterium sp. RRHDQ10]|uniref:alpha/beta hydrolase n=1 Tax=Curtobacterium phyllosphaerae TaxID=3413379 RepID=UPI003BEFD22F